MAFHDTVGSHPDRAPGRNRRACVTAARRMRAGRRGQASSAPDGPRPLHRALQHLVRLGAAHQHPAVHDERGDGVDAVAPRHLARRVHGRAERAGLDLGLGLAGVEADVGDARAQHVPAADVAPLGPVGVHHALVQGVVRSPRPRPLAQLQGPAAVGHPLGVGVVDQPGLLVEPPHGLVGRRRVAPHQVLAGDPLGRVLRVEVERQPVDLGARLAAQPLGPLPRDVAEGADEVAPDRHPHAAETTRPPSRSRPLGPVSRAPE